MVKLYKIKQISLFIALLLIFARCSEWNFMEGEDKTVKVFEDIGPYQHIEIRGIFTVELRQSKQHKVIFTGTNKQLENLSIKNEEKLLKIKTSKNALRQSDYKRPELTIFVDSLKEFWSYQPINLISQDTIRSEKLKIYLIGELSESDFIIRADYFRFINSSSSTGKYTIRGKAERFFCRLRGSSHLEARQLKSERVDFKHESLGDGYVFANNRLNLFSNNSGNLYYTGKPENIETELNASGELIPLE